MTKIAWYTSEHSWHYLLKRVLKKLTIPVGEKCFWMSHRTPYTINQLQMHLYVCGCIRIKNAFQNNLCVKEKIAAMDIIKYLEMSDN